MKRAIFNITCKNIRIMSRRITPYEEPLFSNPVDTFHSEIYLEPSPLDAFIREEVNSDDVPSVTLTSDITMLFNQHRLDKLTQIALVQKFDALSKSNDTLNQVRSKMTDEQLVQFVKSRFIQSPSELLSWANYLSANYEKIGAEMQSQIDVQREHVQESAPSNDTKLES